MNEKLRMYGLVMGANVETVAYFIAAWWGGDWLNDNYPYNEFNWNTCTFVIAAILILRAWIVIIKVLIKLQKSEERE